MITSCNHSAYTKLCGSCQEKNHRQAILDEKDARIAELTEALSDCLRQLQRAINGDPLDGDMVSAELGARWALDGKGENKEVPA